MFAISGKHRGHIRVSFFLVLKLLLVTIDPNLNATVGSGEQGFGGRFIGETVERCINVSPYFGKK